MAFSDRCQRCSAQLRIVDDLPPSADVQQSFRGNINESFVVVPASDPDEFAIAPSGRRGAPLNESFVVVPDGRDEFVDSTGVGATPSAGGAATPSGGGSRSPSLHGGAGVDVGSPEGIHVASMDQVARVEKIMALASGQTEQDHPVCGDCLKAVVIEVQRLVDEAQADHRVYMEAHAQLQERLSSFTDEEAETMEAEIAEMEAEEQRLLGQLSGYDDEERQLHEELEVHRRQEEILQREEDELWLTFAEYQLELEEAEEERAATGSAIRYATSELHRLQRTNVLNDMFHISDKGQFGVITNFRIGRLPDQPVPWEEINAAWGQACLLLDACIKKCGVPTAQYRLLPRGSFSAIQVGNEVFQLYSRDGGLANFFTQRNYDAAMTAFLGCVKEVTKFLQRVPTVTNLPFKIEADKVGGFSIKFLFSQPERWTKALKFLLSDLKWIIAFVESRDRGGAGGAGDRSSGGAVVA